MKSYTDLEQSRKLEEILPIESADCYWEDDMIVEFGHGWHPQHIPCWSLTVLLSVLPYPSLHKTFSGWRCDSYNKEGTSYILGEPSDNPIDACVAMIERLHELKIL